MPAIDELLLREGGDYPLLHWWRGVVVAIRVQRPDSTICGLGSIVGNP